MIHEAKKSLGQNFLKSEPALRMMLEAGEVNSEDEVLEIGPGKGALTIKLLEKAKKVFAVEKDNALFEFLNEKFKKEVSEGKLKLFNDDILEFPIEKHFLKYKIIANIPYNITGLIIKKFLTEKNQPQKMVLLVQKEVAERIVARDKKESILSLSIKAYGEPKYKMKVGKRFFSPAPKVDSAIIEIGNISRKNFNNQKEEKAFFEIIKLGFSHKRKVLRKNLENLKKYDLDIDLIFKKLEIESNSRAEDISFSKWLEISRFLSTKI